GPGASILTFDTVDEVVARANATTYGLGASVYTCDLGRAAEPGRAPRVRADRRQRCVRLHTRDPVRRLQAVGFGPRGRRGRDRSVPGDQVRRRQHLLTKQVA